ncbi:MAG: NTP transferase domain-containing protein [Bacteriovoracaceae bacterium]|jgi:NDP-sugar pyrophosphorylase family protein|nr:NTP transferase domain-containing protein [Bacteriovoracaceae bacterium]
MSIDQCIILAAGYGTRMGEIGKKLPKVMWPLFEYSLLETQIVYASSLGISNVYINIYHQAELIDVRAELKAKVNITFVHEKALLGSGGGIHNILNYSSIKCDKPILILNSDAYLMLNKENLEKSLSKLEASDAAVILFPVPCLASDPYNRLITKNEKLIKISEANDSSESDLTYAGVAICLPSRVAKSSGKSSFFRTIADYKNKDVLVEQYRSWEFVDFGTSSRYFNEIFRVLENIRKEKRSPFLDFMKKRIINNDNLNSENNSYRSKHMNHINFSGSEDRSQNEFMQIAFSKSSIDLDGEESGIVFANIFQKELYEF